MLSLKEKEHLLLNSLCTKHNVSSELIKLLLKSAEENNYSNKSSAERRTEYINLISFHSRKDKRPGDSK